MSIFDGFPRSNAYQINLDWLLSSINTLKKYVENYTAINNISYEGVWDIEKNYPLWSIVTNNDDTYLALQPVPAGVDIANKNYWEVLFTVNPFITKLEENVTELESNVATLSAWQPFVNILELGASEDTGALLNANKSKIQNTTIYFPPGTYKFDTAAALPSNVTILLDNAVFTGAKIFNITDEKNINIIGTGSFIGENSAGSGMFFVECSDVNIDGIFKISNFTSRESVGFEFVNCDNIKIAGLSTNDSKLSLCVDCNHVEICNNHASYEINCYYAISVTRVTNNSYTDIKVHDNYINGGDLLSLAAINISIDSDDGTFNPDNNNYTRNSDISVYNNIIEHCALQCDGIDLLYAHGVSCYSNKIRYCLEGIAVLSEQVTISDNYIALCRGAGIALGDPSLGSVGVVYSGITIANNVIIGNGTGADAIYRQEKTNIMIKNPNGVTVSTAYINNCNISGADYGIWTDDTVDNIVFSNSFIYGNTSSFKSTSPQKITFTGCPVQNYAGYATPPENMTDTTINNYSTPLLIALTNGGTTQLTVYIDEIPAIIVPPSSCASYILNPAHSTRLSASETVAWTWLHV